mgnify:CR=1 FL=1
MAAYFIYTQLEVTDSEALAEYRSKVRATVANHGGRNIVVDPNFEVKEGDWDGINTVVIEFPDMETLKTWYNSDEYKPLLEMRLRASRGNAIFADGI